MAITRKKEQVILHLEPENKINSSIPSEDNAFQKYFDHLDEVTGQLLEAIKRSRNTISENEKKR